MKMSAERGMPKKGGKRKVVGGRWKRAANGFTVHHELEPKQVRQPGGMMMSQHEPDPEPAVFSGPKAKKQMLAHIASLNDQGDEGQEGESPMPGQPAMQA